MASLTAGMPHWTFPTPSTGGPLRHEHGNAPNGVDVRRSTNSHGIGDIRLQFDRWMIDPNSSDANGNSAWVPASNFQPEISPTRTLSITEVMKVRTSPKKWISPFS